jgi:putative phosphoribosyl transferase
MSNVITSAIMTKQVAIPAGVSLQGDLSIPENARGIILFAHGSGSSRISPRNRRVAGQLQQAGFATLLLDLLTWDEETFDILGGKIRFDVELLAERLLATTKWLARDPELRPLPVGYFGASTGAAAALIAASRKPAMLGAVVLRGGRPDLATSFLGEVMVPTLMIAGAMDPPVVEYNRDAIERIGTPVRQLTIIPGATHLFEEPGALEQVAAHARDWFNTYLRIDRRAAEGWEIC